MGKPDAPTPPNPYQTAGAQGATNVSTAIANAMLNNVNQNTPQGSLRYDPTGQYRWNDPNTNALYTIPTFTATQTLTPQGQAIQDQTQATQLNLAGMANQQSGRISGLLSSSMDPTFNAQNYLATNPDVANAARQAGIDPTQFAAQHYRQFGIDQGFSGGNAPRAGNAQSIANVPGAATSYNAGGPITTSYGPTDDFSADRQRVEDSLMQRMNPQLQQEQQRVQQQLADQGIRYGSQAYSDAMLNYSKQANDARFGAIAQGGQEQQRMMDMAAQQAQFGNTAQAQQYQQNAALAAFGNAGLAQQLQQQQAAFNAAQAGRGSYMQEQYAQRNQPINEITSLLSGSQVQQPNFINTPGGQIPTTDIAGLVNSNFQQQMGIYNQQSQNANALIGGFLGLGAGALRASDERVKENIHRVGSVLTVADDADVPRMGSVFGAEDKAELPIYQYSYKNDPVSTRHVGPMAQDVEKIDPKAVKSIGGVKHIDTRRVMGSILRAA